MKLSICTWKWKDKVWKFQGIKGYTSQQVNILQRMIARNLDLEHEFCCITDDPAGLDPSIRVIPLWKDLRHLGACWRRLKLFSVEMRELIGPRICSIDMDVVICGDITPILAAEVPFKIWADGRPDVKYNGGFWLQTTGTKDHLWKHFQPKVHPRRLAGRLGSDQAYLNMMLGPYEHTWDEADGVFSYRWHIRKNGQLPAGARMIFFHGPFDPASSQLQDRHSWIKEHYQ